MSKGILRGKRYSLDYKQYRDRFDQILDTLEDGEGVIDPKTIQALKPDDDVADADTATSNSAGSASNPSQNTVATANGVNAAVSTPINQAATTVLQNAVSPQQKLVEDAFDAFEVGTIGEDMLLAMLGVGSETYAAPAELKLRALQAHTSGALSKAALMKIAA